MNEAEKKKFILELTPTQIGILFGIRLRLATDKSLSVQQQNQIDQIFYGFKPITQPEDLLEKLAELEHNQWWEWSKNLAEKETLTNERIMMWGSLWIPYDELSEDQKESDRIWARKALGILER